MSTKLKNDIYEDFSELSEKLKDPKTLDSELEIQNSNNLNDSSLISIAENESDEDWLNDYRKVLMGNQSIVEQYHDSEIKNARTMLIWSMTLLCVIIFLTVILCIICALKDKTTETILSGTVGTIFSAIVGFITNAFNNTLKSKKSYFDAENETNKNNKMLLLIQIIKNIEARDSLVEDVVRNHFGINK